MKKKKIAFALIPGLLGLHQGNFAEGSKVNTCIDQTNHQISVNFQQKEVQAESFPGVEKSHEEIITMSFDDILKLYGNEKGLDTIRKHFLIEVNKKRAALGNTALELNDALNTVTLIDAQQMAARGDAKHKAPNGQTGIMLLDSVGTFDYEECFFNHTGNVKTTKDVILGFENSKSGHDAIFKNKKCKFVGFSLVKSKSNIDFSSTIYGY